MGLYSVFDMFNTCVKDLDSQELDTCIPVDEQPLAFRAISMVDEAVCSKAKRKFPRMVHQHPFPRYVFTLHHRGIYIIMSSSLVNILAKLRD